MNSSNYNSSKWIPTAGRDGHVSCGDALVDLVFVVDGSGSVGSDAFSQGIAWIRNLTSQFDIGEKNTQIGKDILIVISDNLLFLGLIQYSTAVWSDYFWNDQCVGFMPSTNETIVNNNLNNMFYAGGYTNTGAALT